MKDLIKKISGNIQKNTYIDPELFQKYNVKRGLRNEDSTGVVVGLTKIGDVVGYERNEDGTTRPVPGRLMYRGINLEDIVRGARKDGRCGFEEVVFLLLAGYLPNEEELADFTRMLNERMDLNPRTTMHILELEGRDIMNILARSVLEMYIFDPKAEDTSHENMMEQALNLIASFPTIIAYAYNAYRHNMGRSLHIRHPKKGVSFAENFLYLMKGRNYTQLEVRLLDLILMVHADHGGGNNSAFTVRVTSSTGTDTYSSIAAGIGSMKGPLHGGANKQVADMMANIKANVKDWKNRDEVDTYLKKILNKEAYDRSGLIYGIGHAVYTISDPRTILLKEMAEVLAIEKGKKDEFDFYSLVEEAAVRNFAEVKGTKKRVCANVDYYSGFIYTLIGLPKEIYTPLFAMARVAGWLAHRIEELNFKERRIIRPAYKNAAEIKEYVNLKDRGANSI